MFASNCPLNMIKIWKIPSENDKNNADVGNWIFSKSYEFFEKLFENFLEFFGEFFGTFLGKFGEIFWEEFLGRIFWKKCFERNFLGEEFFGGGTFWEEFFVYIVKVLEYERG